MVVLYFFKFVFDGWLIDDDGNLVVEWFQLVNNLENFDDGICCVFFIGEFWIEVDDFCEDFFCKFFCFFFGYEVCLCGVYLVIVIDVVKNFDGIIVEVYVSYDL